MSIQNNKRAHTLLALSLMGSSFYGYTAGFQLNEYSADGLGRAYAGDAAMAENASSASRNPATMMMFNTPALSLGATFIDPQVDISGQSPSGNSLDAKNIAPTQWVPDAHFVFPLNDKWAFGGSVTSNYGLETQYNDNYAAGAYGGKTDLQTANVNVSAAYRLNEHFSFGLGFDAVYADATLERYAGDLTSIAKTALPRPYRPLVPDLAPDTQIAKMDGSAWGYGWNAGILYEVDKNNRYGLTYRSKVDVDFDGNYRSDLPSGINLTAAGIPLGTGGQTQPGFLTLNLPAMWEISGYNRVAPQWAVHYSMAYTQWSQFQQLKATSGDGGTLFVQPENFHDAYRIALGTTYYYDPQWTFRAGIAFDDSPIPSEYRSIAIPDQDRVWLSMGTTYALTQHSSVDVGISYMHGQNVSIKEGPYTFSATGTAWLYGLNYNYAF